jgi:hypothetical protein
MGSRENCLPGLKLPVQYWASKREQILKSNKIFQTMKKQRLNLDEMKSFSLDFQQTKSVFGGCGTATNMPAGVTITPSGGRTDPAEGDWEDENCCPQK